MPLQMLSNSFIHLLIRSFNVLYRCLPSPRYVLSLMLDTTDRKRNETISFPQGFYSLVGETCLETTVIRCDKDYNGSLYKRQQCHKWNHTGNGWWRDLGKCWQSRVTWEPGLRGGGAIFQVGDGRASQAKGTAEAKVLRHKPCWGKCKKCSLELEFGVQGVSKGKGS